VDRYCSYAYTLCAHEYVANEVRPCACVHARLCVDGSIIRLRPVQDYDKAVLGYRNAIGVNTRHYNAW
jgi:hypothetical protein